MTAKITVEVVGAEAVEREYPKLVQHAVRKRLTGTIRQLGLEVLRKVKQEQLNKPKGSPTGSGGALSRRTGNLSRSINLRVEDTPTRVVASVGTKVIYGRAWELGRVKNWRKQVQKARPFLRPVLDEMKAKIDQRIRAALGKGGVEA